jgi:hypothetical protein
MWLQTLRAPFLRSSSICLFPLTIQRIGKTRNINFCFGYLLFCFDVVWFSVTLQVSGLYQNIAWCNLDIKGKGEANRLMSSR